VSDSVALTFVAINNNIPYRSEHRIINLVDAMGIHAKPHRVEINQIALRSLRLYREISSFGNKEKNNSSF
jgi:hypothetical protein